MVAVSSDAAGASAAGPDGGVLGRLVQTFLDHLVVERGVSRHTVAAYRRDLHRYLAFLAAEGVTEATAVTPGLVAEHAVRLRTGTPAAGGEGWLHPPLAPASVARAVVAVRSLHRFAVDEGVCPTDPAAEVRPPTPGARLPKALRVDQVQALLGVPDTATASGLRDAALLEVLYGTGTRISEAVGLDVDDVTRALAEPASGLRVLGKGGKQRLVPLGSYAGAAVTAYLVRGRPALVSRGSGSPALFLNTRGARLSRQSGWAVLQAVAGKAGLDHDVSPHTLRHSFATHLLDGGADVRVVQELLGHASVTTTQIYTLVTVDHLREVYLTSHPRAY